MTKIELKKTRLGKDHDNLTHCTGCRHYGSNDFYNFDNLKELLENFNPWNYEGVTLCNQCRDKIETGNYKIVAKKGGYGGKYFKKIK